MRIGFLTTQWPGARLGGIGAYTLACARALAAAGHEPHVFTLTLPPDVRAAIPPGIFLHEVDDLAARVHTGILPAPLAAAIHAGGEGAYRLAQGSLLCDAIRQFHARAPLDLVEGPEYEALGLPLLLNRLAGLPVVTHLHSCSAIRRLGNDQPASTENLFIESLEFATAVGATALCAPSHAVVRDTQLVSQFNRPVEVIGLPFAVDPTAAFTPPSSNAPVLYVGRLERLKGMEVLAKAINPFLRRCPSARLRIVGPDTATAPGGGSMARWMALQIDQAYASRVEFVGELTGPALAEAYKNAAFCVVPSLFESYSYVACEALAAGRAVVVSADIGATEVVADAGIIFPRGDSDALGAALAQCHEDRLLLEDLSRRACRRAREVLSTTLAKRIAFYESTVHATDSHFVHHSLQQPLPGAFVHPLFDAIVRLTSALTGISDGRSPGAHLLSIMQRIAAEANAPHATVYLYGAGRHTARLLAEKHLWEQSGHRVIGLVDDHPRFASNPTAWGLRVESLTAFAARLPLPERNTALVLSTDTFQDQFWAQTAALRENGLPIFRLYP